MALGGYGISQSSPSQGPFGVAKGRFPRTSKIFRSLYSGQCVVFDGVNDTVSIASMVGRAINANGFTLSFWFKQISNTTSGSIFTTNPGAPLSGSNTITLICNGTGVINSFLNASNGSGTYENHNSALTWTTNTWTHYALVFSATTGVMKFYKNGGLFFTGNSTSFPPTQTPGFQFATGSNQNMNIDEALWYDRQLSDSEILGLYGGGAGNFTPPLTGLLFRIPFDEGTGTSAKDITGNGYDATLNNGATWAQHT